MKHESQQRSQEQEQLSHFNAQQATREFASTDELLRHDAAQTDVPPAVAERLTQSIAKLPKPSRSWWERLWKR